MAAAGPFEPKPFLALAVSGGSDSMALALLAQRWVKRRKGRIVTLIVDHGLRVESAAEVRLVGRRLAALGLPHRVLHWTGEKPRSGVQAAARAARYDLLTGWCRRNGALHLLTAHHADDQAETVAMRLAHRSGEAGLAGMPLVSARDGVRLVRPLLALRRTALRALLATQQVAWVDDPSNRDIRFERIRLRQDLKAAESERMLARATKAGAARQMQDAAVADLLARVRPMPDAWLAMPIDLFARAPRTIARAGLERCLLCVGGEEHAPRSERLDRLLEELCEPAGFRGRTLGGCRILRWRDALVICREAAAIAATNDMSAKPPLRWDRRFDLRVTGDRKGGLSIRPLGEFAVLPEPLREARRRAALPDAVVEGLPGLCDRQGRVLAVPGLGWRRAGSPATLAVRWHPQRALAPAAFLPVWESCFNRMADYLE